MSKPKPEDIRFQARLDQSIAGIVDNLPPLWRGLFDRLLSANFTQEQSIDLLKQYIHSTTISTAIARATIRNLNERNNPND